jgi:hypothetical protein
MIKENESVDNDIDVNNKKMISKKRNKSVNVNDDDRFKYYKDKELKQEVDPLDLPLVDEEHQDVEAFLVNSKSKSPNYKKVNNIKKTVKSIRTKTIEKIDEIANLHFCHIEDIYGIKHCLEFDQIGDPEFKTQLEDYIKRNKINKKEAQNIYKRYDQAQEGNKVNLAVNKTEKIITPKPKKELPLLIENSQFLDDKVIEQKLNEILDKTIECELSNLTRETLKCSKFIKKIIYYVRGYHVEIDFDKYSNECNPDPKLLSQLKKQGPVLCNPIEILKMLKYAIKKNNDHLIKSAHVLFHKHFKLYIKEIYDIISKCNGSGNKKNDFEKYFDNPNVSYFFKKENVLEINNVSSFVQKGNTWNPHGYIQYLDPLDSRISFFFTFDELSCLVGSLEFNEFLINKVEKKFDPLINQRKSVFNLRKRRIIKRSFAKTFKIARKVSAQSFLMRNDCFKNALTKLFGKLSKMGNNFRNQLRGGDLLSQVRMFNENNQKLRLEITKHCEMNLKDIPFYFNRKCLIVFKIDEFRFHTLAYIPYEEITDPTYLMAKNSWCELYVVDYFLK